MRAYKGKIVLLLPLLLLVSSMVLVGKTGKSQFDSRTLEVPVHSLESGDVVFRKGTSMTSLTVSWLDRTALYTHVGLVLVENDVVEVIHAVPGDRYNELGPPTVIKESLGEFFSHDGVVAISVQRISIDPDSGIAARAADAAVSFVEQGVLFDGAFDLETTDKMYCTELVWRAYKIAGIDLIHGVFDEVRSPFLAKKVIFTSTLLQSSYFTEVASATIH